MADDLFQSAKLEQDAPRPLADRLRPTTLKEIVGQDHLLAQDGPIGRMVASGRLASMILWGPPGVGKTTLAGLLAKTTDLHFEQISAIFSGVGELRRLFDAAEQRRQTGKGTLLFVDEIHRFNKSQQDSFLPHLESGVITLVGATTENPSFELNAAILSRASVFTLRALSVDDMAVLLERAQKLLGRELPLTASARDALFAMAEGDGRYFINMVEELARALEQEELPTGTAWNKEDLEKYLNQRAPLYDKAQDGHYNHASALQKSIRGSDVDAALYWAARMLVAGEDPKFVLRRLVVIASEDVGNADPHALPLAIAARNAFEFLGQPEGEIAIGQLVSYLATAPKSNRSYAAFKKAKSLARKTGSLNPPMHAMNAPTKLMADMGYSDGYVYDHDAPAGYAGLDYFPNELPRENFYAPSDYGFEKEIKKRLQFWEKYRQPRDKK